jgi:hypothetical protein
VLLDYRLKFYTHYIQKQNERTDKQRDQVHTSQLSGEASTSTTPSKGETNSDIILTSFPSFTKVLFLGSSLGFRSFPTVSLRTVGHRSISSTTASDAVLLPSFSTSVDAIRLADESAGRRRSDVESFSADRQVCGVCTRGNR